MSHWYRVVAGVGVYALLCAHAFAAELVIRNAKVMTMDASGTVAEAIAVEGGRIVAVGASSEIAAHVGDATVVYDLQGALVLPGFQDGHNHLVWSATELQDISLYEAATKDDLAESIRAGATQRPQLAWVRGVGWDISAFPDNSLDRKFLDELVPDRPAYFTSADGHTAWVNSRALALAGIAAATKDPEGGRIGREASGEPDGLLYEEATTLVSSRMPEYPAEQVAAGLAEALEEARGFGITSMFDPKAEEWMLNGYKAAIDRDELTLRVVAAIEIKPGEGVAGVARAVALREAYKHNLLKVAGVKLFADGVIETKSAAMLEAYVGSNEAGELLFAPRAMAEIATEAEKQGLQLHFHAIGDRAVRASLDAVAAARAAIGARDLRHQIAHLEVIDPADIARFAELGVYANFQGLWAYPDSYIADLTEPVIGPERSQWLYPIGAVLAAGGTVVGGSDWSVSSMNPLEAIQVAVTRQDIEDDSGRVLTPQHKATVLEMLKAYTINAAKASFAEAETGTLERGKLADIVVLDRDITSVPPQEIAEAVVLMTVFGGKPVYQAEALPQPVK